MSIIDYVRGVGKICVVTDENCYTLVSSLAEISRANNSEVRMKIDFLSRNICIKSINASVESGDAASIGARYPCLPTFSKTIRAILNSSWWGVLRLHDLSKVNKIDAAPAWANDSQQGRDSWVDNSRVWHAFNKCDIIFPFCNTCKAANVRFPRHWFGLDFALISHSFKVDLMILTALILFERTLQAR